jgi:hypothetical protein
MKVSIIATALLSSAATLVAVSGTAKLENVRVKVTEVRYEPGVPRERYIRATDQVIVFLDDCKYERIDSATHAKEIRERKSGEVIWHNKGEDAPVLTNLGAKTYRTLTIELK